MISAEGTEVRELGFGVKPPPKLGKDGRSYGAGNLKDLALGEGRDAPAYVLGKQVGLDALRSEPLTAPPREPDPDSKE